MNNFNNKNNMKKVIGVLMVVGVVGFAAHMAFAELSTMSVAAPASVVAQASSVVATATDSKETETDKIVPNENTSYDIKTENAASPEPTSSVQSLQPAVAAIPAVGVSQTQTTLKDEGKVSGNTEVYVKVEEKVKVATIEVTLSRDDGGTSLYLGKAQFDPSSTQGTLSWNSANTPDGSYKLSTVITTQDGVVANGDTVAVVVKNEEQKTAMVKDTASGKTQQFPEQHSDEKFIESVKNARLTKEQEIKKEIASIVKVPVENKEIGKNISSEALSVKTETSRERSLAEIPPSELKKVVDGKVEELLVAIRESDDEKKKQITEDLAILARISHAREQGAKNEPAANVVFQGAITKTVTDGVAKLEQVVVEQQSGSVDTKNFSVDSVKVAEVATKPDGTPTASKITFHGKALPNSFATLYIFSIPIVVTVKTDSEGNWNYTLDKELEDGKHQVYVAITDVKGKVVSKSSPLPFVKVASAITVEQIAPAMLGQQNPPSLVESNYFYGIIVVIVLIIVAVLIFIGVKRSKELSL